MLSIATAACLTWGAEFDKRHVLLTHPVQWDRAVTELYAQDCGAVVQHYRVKSGREEVT